MNRTTYIFQKLLFSALFLFLFYFPLRAQLLQVTASNTPPFTPQNLITNIFLGDGVEVTNITFNGEPAAVGYFTGGTQSIGIERGIVMTSGAVESTGGIFGTVGCNETGLDFASTDNGVLLNDPDLAALTTSDLNDLAVYTITFIPTADTLRFRYCFGSEEYPEYSCSPYNDVFGFFIQGPGYPTPTNIAKIPGTSLPVTINNIHPANPTPCPAAYLQYYNNNELSNNQPSYDGFTDVFVAEAIVTPCQPYTIKLAIADVSDGVFDSGVFLEAKSFGTGSLRVEVATVSLDGSIVEGCAQGMVKFSVPTALQQALDIDYNIWGTATNGTDYQSIPLNLSIPAGETEISLPIIGIEDNTAEAPEYIAIDVQRDPCNRDTFYIYIKDNALVKPNLGADTTVCVGAQPFQLNGTLPITLPPAPTFTNQQDYSIAPTNTPVNSNINVFGVQPVTLDSGVIRSVCMNITHTWDDDLDIFLISPSGQFLELSTDNGANGDNYTNTCFTPLASTVISSPGPFAPASAAPFTGDWLPEGPWSDLWDGEYPTNGTWQLQIRDDANGFTGTLNDWTITFEPSYKVNYQWSPATGLSCPTCPITNVSPTQTTLYTLVATDSYGCTVSDDIEVEINNALAAPIVTCGGGTSSSLIFNWANVPGATGYQINVNGGSWINVGAVNTYTVTGLTLGSSVTLQVQGLGTSTNCSGLIGSITCVTVGCSPPTATVVTTPVTCFGMNNGSATVTPDGLNPPYTFTLGAQTNSTGIFQNLAAGAYVVTVTDTDGCSASFPVNINSAPQFSAMATLVKNVSCFGGTDGSLNATASGGTGNLTYQWNDPAAQNTPMASNLAAGTYIVIVTDANGCSATATASVTQPPDLVLSALGSLAKCFGQPSGSATASATGGTPSYTFVWSNAVTGPQNPNLLAGNYFVTVTDANGCAETAFVSIGQPSQLTATTTSLPANCAGNANGSATVTPGGGTSPYTFKWSDPLGQTTATASNLLAGNYTVTVTDNNGCSVTQTANVTAPPALNASLSNTNALCNGGTGTATAAPGGGVSPYTFKWSDPAGQTTATATNLLAGNYSVTVTDQLGCTFVGNATIFQPEAISLTANVQNVTCFGSSDGQITVLPGGGITPYAFAWSSGENTPTISGKIAGNYTATVTDANGCTATLQKTISEASDLTLAANATDIKCFGENTGAITLISSGGVPGYNVSWSGPNGFASTQSSLENLFAGTYSATVTDNASCSKTLSINVTQPESALALTLPAIADTICFLAANGTATVISAGGTSPYTYLWSNGQTAQTATNLSSLPYNVTVTDANGCTQAAETFIFQKEELFAYAESAPPPCYDQPQGTASVTAVFYGATPANLNDFNYLWNSVPAQTGIQATGLKPNQTYEVTVTDALGCTDVQTVAVGNAPEFLATITATGNVKCFGEATGWAEAGGVGGATPYTYFWATGGQTTQTAQNLAAGTHNVTVTDVNGCIAKATATIAQPPALDVNLFPTDVKCFGESNGSAKAVPSGGTPPYIYLWWSGGQQTQEIKNLPAGVVGLSLTDANGCQVLDSVEIEQPASPVGGSATQRDAGCFGSHDGQITLTAEGGTPPYRYALNDKPFNGSPIQIGLSAGIYLPKIMDKNGCIFELPLIEVRQRDKIEVNLGPDVTIILGESTQLFVQVENAAGQISYAWTAEDSVWLSCLDCADPFVDSLYYQNYFEVRVVDSLGCVGTDRIQVVVEKPRKVFVPTGFTPNGDLNNDILQVHGQSTARVLEFRVYDRWGELVYEARDFPLNDPDTGWDGNFRGKAMDPGVYVWVLEVEYMDGAKEVFKGNTTLIR